jgi:hypothetical protein
VAGIADFDAQIVQFGSPWVVFGFGFVFSL